MKRPASPLDLALRYAELGWAVFPCNQEIDPSTKKERKNPLTKNGFKDATTEAPAIRRWWAKWPKALVGIACEPSGLVVIDLDLDEKKKKNGPKVFEQFCGAQPHGSSLVASTPRGGRHLYYRAPGEPIKSTTDWLDAVDTRAAGGYVIAPGSAGREWLEGAPGEQTELPAWLRDALPKRDAAAKETRTSDSKAKVEPGSASPEELQDAVQLLHRLDPCLLSRDEWLHAIWSFAAAAQRDPRGELHVEAWSSLDAARFEHGESARKYREGNGEIGAGTLHHMVQNLSLQRGALAAGLLSLQREALAAGLSKRSEPKIGKSLGELLDEMRVEGEIEPMPTGIAKLDEMLLVEGVLPGYLHVLVGAPEASKTTLAVRIADHALTCGAFVGFYCADEEPQDTLTRLAQKRGADRKALLRRRSGSLDQAAALLEDTGACRAYGFDDAIEDVAADVAAHARAEGRRGVLLIDSLQQMRTRNSARFSEDYARLSEGVVLLRRLAKKHRLILWATSEANRASRVDKTPDRRMASGSGSGKIEYGARVLLQLEARGDDAVQVFVVKNKLGSVGDFCLRIDKATQTVEELLFAAEPEDHFEKRAAANEAREKLLDALVEMQVAKAPGISPNKIRNGIEGFRNEDIDRAIERGIEEGRLRDMGTAKRRKLFVAEQAPKGD